MTTIALIEDNDDLRALTEIYLCRQGFVVNAYADAEDFLASPQKSDVFVIDINLPDMSGFELVEKLRKTEPTACLIILSARDRKADIVRGYDLGADIYLAKPVEPEVLLAAIRRLASRIKPKKNGMSALEVSTTKLTFGDSFRKISRDEYTLLHRLSVAGSRGLERHEIAECLGFNLDNYSSKALEVRVLRLRRKITELGVDASFIQTIRGIGYCINDDAKVIFR